MAVETLRCPECDGPAVANRGDWRCDRGEIHAPDVDPLGRKIPESQRPRFLTCGTTGVVLDDRLIVTGKVRQPDRTPHHEHTVTVVETVRGQHIPLHRGRMAIPKKRRSH